MGPTYFNRVPFDGARGGPWACTGGGRAARPGMFAAYAAWSAREIELQVLATLAALAQISTPSAAHFLKSHRLLVQKFAADRDRQRSSFKPFRGSRRPHGVALLGDEAATRKVVYERLVDGRAAPVAAGHALSRAEMSSLASRLESSEVELAVQEQCHIDEVADGSDRLLRHDGIGHPNPSVAML